MLLFCLSTVAKPSPELPDLKSQAGNRRAVKNGFLFLLTKNNKTSFLLGTIHSGVSEKQIIGDNILNAATESSKIFIEADIFDPARTRDAMIFFGTDKHPQNLRSTIGDVYYDFFRKMFVGNYKILKPDEYNSAKPWFLTLLIPIADASKETYMRSELGTEFQLLNLATNINIPIGELEGLSQQLKLFDSINKNDDGRYFNDYVDLVQERTLYHWQLKEVQAWTDQNIDGIHEVLKSMDERSSAYTRFYLSTMIKSRNVSLARTIAEIAENKDKCLFAIGSEHLTHSFTHISSPA
jgi:uncharacterized protein YbaP (TraB family)